MVVIAVYTVICGACGWVDIANTAMVRIEELKKFIELPNGIPSHDTFGRVFRRIDPTELEKALSCWLAGLMRSHKGETLAMDGKTLRRSFDTAAGLSALHSISLYATECRMVLGQLFGYDKDSEIPQGVELLKLLDIQGAVVTIDAIGCQKKTAAQIVEGSRADYVIACKKNQPGLSDFIEDCFKDADVHGGRYSMSFHSTLDAGEHGRYDSRSCACIDVSPWASSVFPGWKGLKTIARVTSIPDSMSARKPATRYFISSLPCDARDILGRTRGHWQIENGLHYVLDVTFREDDCRIRKDNGPRNFAVFRRAALALVRSNMASAGDPKITTCRQAVRMAALNPAYAVALFTGGSV
jgi:predicted transposase YbfD/YdcC